MTERPQCQLPDCSWPKCWDRTLGCTRCKYNDVQDRFLHGEGPPPCPQCKGWRTISVVVKRRFETLGSPIVQTFADSDITMCPSCDGVGVIVPKDRRF